MLRGLPTRRLQHTHGHSNFKKVFKRALAVETVICGVSVAPDLAGALAPLVATRGWCSGRRRRCSRDNSWKRTQIAAPRLCSQNAAPSCHCLASLEWAAANHHCAASGRVCFIVSSPCERTALMHTMSPVTRVVSVLCCAPRRRMHRATCTLISVCNVHTEHPCHSSPFT